MMQLSEKANRYTGTEVLLEAMSKDKIHLARFILEALDGKIINSKTDGAQTLLIASVLRANTPSRSKFMNLLLEKGASVNCQDETGRTAISYACEKGYLDAVKILVQNNADPELEDMWGNTALMYAAVAGHSSVVEFLVRSFKRLGLQIDRQNKVGNSAVEVAKYLGHKDCLFALTSNDKKSRVNDVGSRRDKLSLGNLDNPLNGDRFVCASADNFEVTELSDNILKCPRDKKNGTIDATWLAATSDRKVSLLLKNKIQSMDSIEEFERESDGLSSSPGLSDVLNPKPPTQLFHPYNADNNFKRETNTTWFHLPPLPARGSDTQTPVLWKSCAPTCTGTFTSNRLGSPLGILLTPIMGNTSGIEETEYENREKAVFDFGIRRFDDSYYKKRCSLPTSVLSPVPPGRSLIPLPQSKTVIKNSSVTLGNNEAPSSTEIVVPTTFNKLFRRFTFPDFKKTRREIQTGGCAALWGNPEMPRSETFPKSRNHPQVSSKPSIDSISGVKCEFDFPFKTA